MKRVFGYCRVSTVGQAEEGDSLDAQENKIKEYCKLKKLDLISVHKEMGISGAVEPRKRPQLALILANLDAKNGDGLVCTKIDRLSRSTKDFLNLIDDFKQKKFKFFCITPEIDTDTTIGEFTMNLLSIISQLERGMISDRVKDVFANKRKNNEVLGQVPFGKRLKPNSNILEDDPDEQETIEIVKQLRKTKIMNEFGKEKKMTLNDICKDLVSRKRLNKEGNVSWFPANVRRILGDGDYNPKKNN